MEILRSSGQKSWDMFYWTTLYILLYFDSVDCVSYLWHIDVSFILSSGDEWRVSLWFFLVQWLQGC